MKTLICYRLSSVFQPINNLHLILMMAVGVACTLETTEIDHKTKIIQVLCQTEVITNSGLKQWTVDFLDINKVVSIQPLYNPAMSVKPVEISKLKAQTFKQISNTIINHNLWQNENDTLKWSQWAWTTNLWIYRIKEETKTKTTLKIVKFKQFAEKTLDLRMTLMTVKTWHALQWITLRATSSN